MTALDNLPYGRWPTSALEAVVRQYSDPEAAAELARRNNPADSGPRSPVTGREPANRRTPTGTPTPPTASP